MEAKNLTSRTDAVSSFRQFLFVSGRMKRKPEGLLVPVAFLLVTLVEMMCVNEDKKALARIGRVWKSRDPPRLGMTSH